MPKPNLKTIVFKKPSAISFIKFRMENMYLTQKDLIPYFGSKSKVSEVLSGQRRLSLVMIKKLHIGLRIPLEILLEIDAYKKTWKEPSHS